MSVPMEPINPCICRNASRYAVRSVRHVSIAKSEYLRWPPRDVRRGAPTRHVGMSLESVSMARLHNDHVEARLP